MNSKTALFSGLLITIIGGVTVEYIRQEYLSSDNDEHEVIEQQIRREIELEQEIKKEKEARRRAESGLEKNEIIRQSLPAGSQEECIYWIREAGTRGGLDKMRSGIRPAYIPKDAWEECNFEGVFRSVSKARRIIDSMGR